MDRGQAGDDGPDEVELSVDDGAPEPADDGAVAPGAGTVVGDAGGTGDARPARWLADVRARAPWLLEPGGALEPVTGAQARPDIVPHGEALSASSSRGGNSVQWPELAARPSPQERPARLPPDGGRSHEADGAAFPPARALPDADHITAGDEGPPASAGGPGGPGLGSGAVPDRPSPPTHPAPAEYADGDGERLRANEGPDVPAVDPQGTISDVASRSDADRDTRALDADSPARPPAAHTPAVWPEPTARRPAFDRSSATWPPPAARPTGPPAWPAPSQPEPTTLRSDRQIAEPERPMRRPVTPFAVDHPRPGRPATRGVFDTTWWTEVTDRRSMALPARDGLDRDAIAAWPSLLDDEDDDAHDGPDGTQYDRAFDRRLRLDREQRRR